MAEIEWDQLPESHKDQVTNLLAGAIANADVWARDHGHSREQSEGIAKNRRAIMRAALRKLGRG